MKPHLRNLKEFYPTTDNVWERGKQLNEWISARREKRWKEYNEAMAFVCILVCGVMLLLMLMPFWAPLVKGL